MNMLIIGYVNGELHHAYIKDIHGQSHAVNLTTATCLARELIQGGAVLKTVRLSEQNEYDQIDF